MSGHGKYQVEELTLSDSVEYASLFVRCFEDRFAMFDDKEKLQLPQILIDLGNFSPSDYESFYVIKNNGQITALLSASYPLQTEIPPHKKIREGISLLQKISVKQIINLYVLGKLTISDPHPGDCYIDALAVDSGQRGRGMAQTLLDFALHQATSYDGIKRIVLDVAADNIPAQMLYRSYGMKAQKPRSNYAAGVFIHSNQRIRMTLDLSKYR